MNRTPPIEVRRFLRKEVNFGCPVDGCGNPYLEWHHFEPAWSVKNHHNPEGMIALCAEHHKKADAGAYTKDQLKSFKNNIQVDVQGKFDWLRNDLLVVVGGNFYYETPRVFEFKDKSIIWFNRDENGYLLLNLIMLSTSKEERAFIQDNFWMKRGNPSDLESPPSGKILKIQYDNNDFFRVEYYELRNFEDIKKRFPDVSPEYWQVKFPITAVEIHYKVGNTDIEFNPRSTKIGGMFMTNCFLSHCGCGISLN
ncbi:MAG: hypothetical protein ACD_20C00199G0005 [uncultured bacterium]|nr:MAG: hypothetical protein ACD_20C00199G0005 [uncultured bacterium]